MVALMNRLSKERSAPSGSSKEADGAVVEDPNPTQREEAKPIESTMQEPKPTENKGSERTDVVPSSTEVDDHGSVDEDKMEQVKHDSMDPSSDVGAVVGAQDAAEEANETQVVNENVAEADPEDSVKRGSSSTPSPFVWTKDGTDVPPEYNTRPQRVEKKNRRAPA